MSKNIYDVIVVGAGHAGYEAALAASRMKAKTAMITMETQAIGRMSCNPSIGGMAKSHIVYELDALGGELGRNADFTGIQFRTLNTRKGPAVQSTRVQNDKEAFSLRVKNNLKKEPLLTIIEDIVGEIWIENGKLKGVKTEKDEEIRGKSVVITCGTFLCGKIHIGKNNFPGGRFGEKSAKKLSKSLQELGLHMERLKTGTPPRLYKDSLEYGKMKIQKGESPPPFFSRKAQKTWGMFHVEHRPTLCNQESFLSEEKIKFFQETYIPGLHQTSCYLTNTTPKTHQIILKNLTKSAMYGGKIKATGVRYCPSIEDKIVKFSDRDSHQVFVEPEGKNSVSMYPAGTSNSLPEDVQIQMIQSIPGMAYAKFIQPGYAIEYNFCDPTQLYHSLETKNLGNLYLAGQINGTTGYEEAACQGFVAGVNAVLKLQNNPPFILHRHEGYIGVLIDDLVTKGTDEPYRMFTSRAEYRLLLRQDNARIRLKEYAKKIGIISEKELKETDIFQLNTKKEIKRLNKVFINGVSLVQLLRRPEMTYNDLPVKSNNHYTKEEIQQIEISVKYEGYINRDLEKIARQEKVDKIKIPREIVYDEISALRFEAREKLKKIQPLTLGQAARISGVNPSDISILSVWSKRISSESVSN